MSAKHLHEEAPFDAARSAVHTDNDPDHKPPVAPIMSANHPSRPDGPLRPPPHEQLPPQE